MSVHDITGKTRAQELIARGMTTDQVGREIGVSGRTVRRWREDPAFSAGISEARRAIVQEAAAAIGAAAKDAVTTLHQALGDDSPTIRIQAARTILTSLPGLLEHAELEERLAALEAATPVRGIA
ncbi:helix-turn-helix domain-containing protein [Kitasatospora cineracea]